VTYRKDPLQGKRSSPGPFVVSLVVAVCSSGDNDATDRPGHLESRCASTTEHQRDDLGSVGGRVGNKQSPRDTFESLSDNKHLE
jgi:hypothetical protein